MRYLIGTRGSKLALVQTDYVIDKLKEHIWMMILRLLS